MFTGLTETKGVLSRRTARGPSAELMITCTLQGEPLALGESIAVDGVCLTVTTIVPGGFLADASAETLARTTLGQTKQGSHVNLERALLATGRFGGHIVSGHVDGTGRLAKREASGDAAILTFSAPPELSKFFAEKGSVTISGVSLTVNGVTASTFDVMLIPHTLDRTTLGALRPGDPVNLEVDLLARYVARLLEKEPATGREETFRERLARNGYL